MAQTSQRRIKEAMYPIIEQWQSSGLNKQTFCDQHGIAKSVFFYWHKKYKADQEPGGFLPIKIGNNSPTSLVSKIEIEYPQWSGTPIARSYAFNSHQGIHAPVAMFSLTTSHEFLLYRRVTDFRKGFDGLCGLVRNELDRDPSSGEVFVFVNRPRNLINLVNELLILHF